MAVRHYQSGERGAGRTGSLFSLFILVALGYFVARSAPLYIHKVQFQDALTEVVRLGALQNLSETEMRTRLTLKATELDIPHDARIEIHRKGKLVTARVDYTQDIMLPFYTYNWPINLVAQETGF
jgi:hypothetical protein